MVSNKLLNVTMQSLAQMDRERKRMIVKKSRNNYLHSLRDF